MISVLKQLIFTTKVRAMGEDGMVFNEEVADSCELEEHDAVGEDDR